MKTRSSKRAKACDIPKRVKDAVWERDEGCCIFCHSNQAMPNSHYIPRSLGGLGIEENVVTMCIACHEQYERNRKKLKPRVASYLRACYPDWDDTELVYHKYDTLPVRKGYK